MDSPAANRIPDEIVSEILTPLLKHSDEVFRDQSEKALLDPDHSASRYLLVSKSWLRVSTPLLYNVVILRTTAQAEALQTVLKTNKEFGLFIKKLRVEGWLRQCDAHHSQKRPQHHGLVSDPLYRRI
ncbi:F-box domain-containing protein [Mycena sanguinolenta]|uniref:F-box domain-containing protein n=1 Tax=Mycena sanguinolenta TaxID=230812 RepID=A0A8H6ZC64_9AGAR|nr:F-box domain-containing protein [Mycena sanguinolenta]